MPESPVELRRQTGGARRYVRGALGLSGLRVISLGLGFAATVVLSRGLGPENFGVFAFVISFATLLALPLTGGLPTLIMREIAAAEANQASALQAGVKRWGFRIWTAITLSLWGVFGLAWVAGQILEIWPWDGQATLLALIVVLLAPALGLQQVLRGILAGHDRVVLGNLGEQLFRPAILMVLLLALQGLVLPKGSVAALWLQMTATLGAIALSLFVIWRILPRQTTGSIEIRNREWLMALLPLTALSATTIIKNNTDVLMLGILVEPTEVGLYRIASQVALLAAFAMHILRATAAPRIAFAYANDDTTEMRRHFVLGGRFMFGFSALFVLFFALLGKPALLLFFGPEYIGAWAPCLVLACGTLFSTACGFVGVALQVTRHAGYAARAAVIAALVNVLLNFVFIPLWGALGAAMATSLALFTMQAQQWWIACRVLKMRTDVFQRV